MSASPFLSKHLPGVSSGVVSIPAADAGVAVIDTGLRVVKNATANIKADGVTANEESDVTVNWAVSGLEPNQIRVTVEKGGTAHGTAADSDVDVSFTAHGDR